MTSPSVPLTSLPIASRPKHSLSLPRSIVFNSFFLLTIVLLHSTQLVILPFAVLPWPEGAKDVFWYGNERIKENFALLLVTIIQWFGPTKFVITAGDGVDLDKLVKRDPKTGGVVYLDLPKRCVTMANHQMYADWLYIWCLNYYARTHGSIIIILKASLKWIPIVGPAMQLFRFIFLARSWAHDKIGLSSHLAQLGSEATDHRPAEGKTRDPLNLLIFPEGTLVSPLTRPTSRKFAEKMGIPDMKYQLLPRSTGLLFCMRALRLRIPDLTLVDLTIGYEGIPPDGYGQDYYTLQSIFGYGHSPPAVHVHVRLIPLDTVPLGSLPPPTLVPPSSHKPSKKTAEVADPSPEEAKVFDEWLRERWTEKDKLMEDFYAKGRFPSESMDKKGKDSVEVKVRILSPKDAAQLAGYCVPGWIAVRAGWTLTKAVFSSLFFR